MENPIYEYELGFKRKWNCEIFKVVGLRSIYYSIVMCFSFSQIGKIFWEFYEQKKNTWKMLRINSNIKCTFNFINQIKNNSPFIWIKKLCKWSFLEFGDIMWPC